LKILPLLSTYKSNLLTGENVQYAIDAISWKIMIVIMMKNLTIYSNIFILYYLFCVSQQNIWHWKFREKMLSIHPIILNGWKINSIIWKVSFFWLERPELNCDLLCLLLTSHFFKNWFFNVLLSLSLSLSLTHTTYRHIHTHIQSLSNSHTHIHTHNT
jgi:hypothetical protein